MSDDLDNKTTAELLEEQKALNKAILAAQTQRKDLETKEKKGFSIKGLFEFKEAMEEMKIPVPSLISAILKKYNLLDVGARILTGQDLDSLRNPENISKMKDEMKLEDEGKQNPLKALIVSLFDRITLSPEAAAKVEVSKNLEALQEQQANLKIEIDARIVAEKKLNQQPSPAELERRELKARNDLALEELRTAEIKAKQEAMLKKKSKPKGGAAEDTSLKALASDVKPIPGVTGEEVAEDRAAADLRKEGAIPEKDQSKEVMHL